MNRVQNIFLLVFYSRALRDGCNSTFVCYDYKKKKWDMSRVSRINNTDE